MLDNIVSVTSISKSFKIVWDVESACNYNCSYCFPGRHEHIASRNYKLKTASELRKYWKIVHDSIDPSRLIDVNISGGEPTLNKNLIDLIRFIREHTNVDYLGITTNGSASTNFYTQLIPHLTALSISVHSEFFNEKKLFDTIYQCKQYISSNSYKCILHVLIMNEPNDRINLYQDFCIKNDIYYTVQNIIHDTPINLLKPTHNTKYRFTQ